MLYTRCRLGYNISMDTATVLTGVIFGSIGTGYFIYGKKNARLVPMLAGVILFIVPYAISNIYVLILISIAAMALPFFLK